MKAVLRKKIDEWIRSISDPKLQDMVRADTIVTGGAIASMLMGEQVHDFDVYFAKLDTVKAVADYYVGKFNELHADHQAVVRVENERVRIKIQSAGIAGEKTPESQYQYFEGRPLEEGEGYVAEVFKNVMADADGLDGTAIEDSKKSPYRPVFLSDNAITLSNKIQIVVRFWGEPADIHKNFDFVHCTSYWKSVDGFLYLSPDAMESILARELRYVGSLYPVCSFIRTRKFIKAGWHINAGHMLKICMQLSELDLTNVEVLEDQLTGVDTAYFLQVIDYLKERQIREPEFKVSVPYLISIIDKIF
jgi:hypothetical protein